MKVRGVKAFGWKPLRPEVVDAVKSLFTDSYKPGNPRRATPQGILLPKILRPIGPMPHFEMEDLEGELVDRLQSFPYDDEVRELIRTRGSFEVDCEFMCRFPKRKSAAGE